MPDRFDQYYASFRRGNRGLRITLILSVAVHIVIMIGLLAWYRIQLKPEPATEFEMFVMAAESAEDVPEQPAAPEVSETEMPEQQEPPPRPEPPKPPEPEPKPPEPPKPVEEKKPEPKPVEEKPEALNLEDEGEEEKMEEPPPKPPEPPKPDPPKPKPPEPKKPDPPKPDPPKPTPPKPKPAPPEPPKQAAPTEGTLRMGSGRTDRPDLASWANRVQRKVERVWAKPGGVSLDPASSTVEITFWVDRNGNLLDEPRVSSTGSDPRLADSALNAVKLAAPYAPLPESYNQPELVVKYEFSLAR